MTNEEIDRALTALSVNGHLFYQADEPDRRFAILGPGMVDLISRAQSSLDIKVLAFEDKVQIDEMTADDELRSIYERWAMETSEVATKYPLRPN